MRPLDHAKLAEALLPAVLAAGRIEMNYYACALSVEAKADASPVTAADREAEAVLLAALHAVEPDVPVVAEESAAAGFVPPTGEAFFLVDPLDGTREFIKKCDEFTVNIGLVHAGRPVFGIVYAPALSALYLTVGAARAAEARIAPGATSAALADLTLTPLHTRAPDPAALVALESRSHRSPGTEAFLARYPIAATRQSGSSLKFCLIARGDADLYPRIGSTSEWDTAAGQAVLEAAGGCVATLEGAPLVYGKAHAGYINPHFVAWGRAPLAPTRS